MLRWENSIQWSIARQGKKGVRQQTKPWLTEGICKSGKL